MKMRDLEQRTGVNRETIRVYLRHGLMPEPARSARNVADYGEEHVRSILAIRKLQKEKRLPLGLIKRAMEGDTSALPQDAGAFPHLDSLVAARVGADDARVPLSSVLPRNPEAERDASTLQAIGAIELIQYRGKPHLSRVDAQLVGLWGDMRAAGFTEALGFDPSICRLHVETAQALAHQELKIFLDRVEGQQHEDPTADMAYAAINHLLAFFGLIRVKTVLADLRSRAVSRGLETTTPEPSPRKRTRRRTA